MRTHIFIALFFLIGISTFAQQGKHGAQTVNALNVRINEFTALTTPTVNVGTSTIQVISALLNTNSRFTNTLQVGDLIMIIQMQGSVIKSFSTVGGQDSTYGEILNYGGAGNYEFAQVFAIPNATTIVLDCGLTHSYTAAGKTQIVRVPRYTSLTVNAGASLTTDAWNGTFGGVLTAEVSGLTTINGTVTATGLGFRGGLASNNGTFGGSRHVDVLAGPNEGGLKGESVAGFTVDLVNNFFGAYSKGAPANGGGGGNSHNAGGGGGANAGLGNWFGHGVINPSYTLAYSIEFPNRHTIVSSGGGKGGYCFSSANLNPNSVAPGNTTWGGDSRRNHGGFGGRPLDYSTGRIYLGGGGGAGHVNNISATNTGGTGGAGGGIIYILSHGNIGGNGVVVSNGNNGTTATGPNPGAFSSNVNGNDSGGGGGAGGTVLLATEGNVSGISINANGGRGGDQIIVKGGFAGSNTEAEGPGGGGGGGYIAISGGTPVQSVLGAVSGTTNSNPMVNFPPNGASNGGNGLSNQDVKLNTISVANVTVCVNSAASLTATTNNPLVSGFNWYNSLAGPTQIGTGAVFTTSVYTAPGTYTLFAGMCPGIYRVPVIITVNNTPTISVNSATICGAQTVTLSASGVGTFTWSTGSNNSSITVSPSVTTVYTVSGTSGCTAQATTTVQVQALPTVTASATSTLICNNQSVTLNANGSVGTYSWSNGATNTFSTSANLPGTYTVTNTNGCGVSTSTIALSEGPSTLIAIGASQNTICTGGTVTISATGTGTFAWSTSTVNTSSITVTTPGIYFVTLANECGVSSSSISISNGPPPTIGIVPSQSLFCSGQPAVLTVTGSATSYTWNTGSNSSSITTAVAGNFSVAATNSCGATSSAFTVTFQNSPDISVISNKSFICEGDSALLTASNLSGGGNYAWSSSANISNVELVKAGGVYTVSYSNICGSTSATIAVRQSTLIPDFIFSPSAGTAPLSVSFTNTSISNINNNWNFGNSQTSSNVDDVSQYSSPGIYTITLLITNSDGCSAAVSKTLEVLSDIAPEVPLGLIPELVTPNSDGKNDVFEIKGIENYPQNELEIYNRWGNKVYSATGYKNTFDGTPNYKGLSDGRLPVGTYFFILKLNDKDNRIFKGYLELMY
jgi:gliding motility-associated-like protein